MDNGKLYVFIIIYFLIWVSDYKNRTNYCLKHSVGELKRFTCKLRNFHIDVVIRQINDSLNTYALGHMYH